MKAGTHTKGTGGRGSGTKHVVGSTSATTAGTGGNVKRPKLVKR